MSLLDEIAAVRDLRIALSKASTEVDDRLTKLIREAFEAGFTGPQIAEHAGISKARVYQIRDGLR
ncbi:hypothetical protein AVANI_48 [Mycobacterium phage Avani]|uniref:Helix-turn-helix DNA binding domain protein n=3 Tax=Gracegardnervirinae TaxID=2946632 RepID=A0A386KRW0_9CAUD|nr:HTH DNA binding protein [Mycobacterium phage Avani]YP_009209593.1 HTH DNA binding protein [Mycobacterium phage Llama]YP_009954524.1 HTH DNA binding protein [Mycobacterium phage ArcusAngelus]YP_010101056.1 HTH DNA binding protein [Mycobacterium phage Ochi17]QFP96427.1 RNA polymerase sigma factor [Mycobacterium phage Modragons]QOP67127.1 hypothetical protein SEA_SEABASTIAN_44 [Mycobacterium phage Seabastian]QOP67238.1 hypothetical protein SEA_OFULTRON_44 [Mycobacterium phage OfUltron]WNM648